MPPPEVCDWLLAQEWSGVIPAAITAFPEGGPGGIAAHTAYNHVYARSALGTDETFAIELPVEALEVLIEDAAARLESAELRRRELAPDELARKEVREQNRVDETEEEGLDPENEVVLRGGPRDGHRVKLRQDYPPPAAIEVPAWKEGYDGQGERREMHIYQARIFSGGIHYCFIPPETV